MRRENDAYFTPIEATEELVARLPLRGRRILEPASGENAIALVLAGEDASVTTNDIDRSRPATTHYDATDPLTWREWQDFDWIIGNPPFLWAHEIIPRAVDAAKIGVAMLLRLSWLEPCEGRAAWLEENPPRGLIVLPRISFTGDGKTDSVTCAWMIWGERPVGFFGIEVVRRHDLAQPSLLNASLASETAGEGG